VTDLRPFLAGVADWLGSREKEPGVLVCEKHKVEHTGTGSYLVLLDAIRASESKDDRALARAQRVALRVADRTAEDPAEAYGAWIVLPGSRDPHNHASNVIDAGCAIDSLATLGRLHGGDLPRESRDRIEATVRKVADTYLVPHAMPKEILAQRLWGVAALGSAYAWLGEPRWRAAGLAAIERTWSQQHRDGSFPYTPLGTPRSHEGSSDASAFYQSRHALFAAHALASFGEPLDRPQHADRLRAACDFLLALRRADGTKTPLVEAKPWYWQSDYEVAGAPFDAASLAACARALSEPRYLGAAAEMLELLLAHVEPDGGITSHRGPGWSFQCRFFWNAHCAWIARERAALESARPAASDGGLRWFADAGVARFADERFVAIARGAKPRSSWLHGSPFGGGGLLHAASRRAPMTELIGKRVGDVPPAGEWHVVPRDGSGLVSRLRRAWSRRRDELRFALWIARVRARSGDVSGAVASAMATARRGWLDAARGGAGSGAASEVEGAVVGSSLAFRGTVADALGDTLPGVRTIRRYVFEPGCVRVGDALIADRDLRRVRYRLPRGARDAELDTDAARVERGVVEYRRVAAGSTLSVRYRIAAE